MLVFRAALACAAILAASSLAACFGGDTSSSSGQGGDGGAGPFMTAPHPAPPQVVNVGGSVLKAPKVQLIAYASDPFAPDVEKFVAELATTSTWSEQTAEYGVGPFTALPTIQIAGAPPALLDDDTDQHSVFADDFAAQISGPNPAWGAADPNTIYLFLLPLGTDIASAGNCCTDFFGYHWEAAVGTSSVPYGIVCNCPAEMGDLLTPLQYVTTTVIHEMVEIATDPFIYSSPAFEQNDDDHIIWTIATGGEISDMCEYHEDANPTPPGATYTVQRSWSNAAAKAGKNPCVPVVTTDPYFASDPVLPDVVSVDYYGTPMDTRGVKIAKGQTRTIDVQLWSEAETAGPWTVTAYDLNDWLVGGKPNLEVTLDKTSGLNGDKLKLTITVLSTQTLVGAEGFVLVSDLGGQQSISMGVVGQ
jgi:hypothetical protein